MVFFSEGDPSNRRRTTMADTTEWRADPERDAQERHWDDADWTDEVRQGGRDEPGAGFGRPPDHVPQLHRALSEAAADLDAVEDRLSTLFDRDEGPRPGAAQRPAAAPTPARRSTLHDEVASGDDDILDLFEDSEAEEADDDVGFAQPATTAVTDRMAIIGEYEDDIGGEFAALDAELAAEAPDEAGKSKRRMFRRRAKGTTAAQR
jgi:hypothetical protein